MLLRTIQRYENDIKEVNDAIAKLKTNLYEFMRQKSAFYKKVRELRQSKDKKVKN